MTKLKRFGFFRELEHGDEGGDSLATLHGTAVYDEFERKRIVTYLQTGQMYIVSPGPVVDVLAPEKNTIIGTASVLTDGIWAWPADLAHYVANHYVPVPPAMAETMEGNNWTVSDDVDITKLEL